MIEFKKLKGFVVDNDDTLFRSSPLISEYTAINWPQFSSDNLKIRERTISIVQEFYKLVNDEIQTAISNGRVPNLEQFEVKAPVDIPNFDMKRLDAYNRTIAIIEYMYKRVQNEINNARSKGVLPNLPNFNVNRNDVIRGNEVVSADFGYEKYIRPLDEILESREQVKAEKKQFLNNDPNSFIVPYEEINVSNNLKENDYIDYVKGILECLELVKHSKEMFLECRDKTLEADGKLAIGKIPYDKIYGEDSWFPYVKENVRELYNTFGERMISLTAHNGIDNDHGRELEAKGEAIHKMNPNIKHYGQRFHSTEHVPGYRRPRADKGDTIERIYNTESLNGFVILEDSQEVLLMTLKHGASPIFINYDHRPNPYGFAEVHSTKPESIYRVLCELGYDSDSEEILQLPKSKVKTL